MHERPCSLSNSKVWRKIIHQLKIQVLFPAEALGFGHPINVAMQKYLGSATRKIWRCFDLDISLILTICLGHRPSRRASVMYRRLSFRCENCISYTCTWSRYVCMRPIANILITCPNSAYTNPLRRKEEPLAASHMHVAIATQFTSDGTDYFDTI